MISVRIDDRLPMFSNKAKNYLNDALKEGAKDILARSNDLAPYKDGGLRVNKDANQTGRMQWTVTYWNKYARFQEFGGDGRRVVRHYTTSGTGKGYLKKSGDQVANAMSLIFAKHGGRA
jgi:hypothetical protein